TTATDIENACISSIKEQQSFYGEKLLELGFAFDQYGLKQIPAGSAPFVETPEGSLGNYYSHARTNTQRWQALSNFYFPHEWHGRHDFLFGADLDRLSYDQSFLRTPVSSLREGQAITPGTNCLGSMPSPCALYTVFGSGQPSTIYNSEASLYAQDRWSPVARLLVESGLRFDWDEIVRRPLVAPRIAGTYVLDSAGNTKVSAGAGVIFSSTNLYLIGLPLQGSRQDFFF